MYKRSTNHPAITAALALKERHDELRQLDPPQKLHRPTTAQLKESQVLRAYEQAVEVQDKLLQYFLRDPSGRRAQTQFIKATLYRFSISNPIEYVQKLRDFGEEFAIDLTLLAPVTSPSAFNVEKALSPEPVRAASTVCKRKELAHGDEPNVLHAQEADHESTRNVAAVPAIATVETPPEAQATSLMALTDTPIASEMAVKRPRIENEQLRLYQACIIMIREATESTGSQQVEVLGAQVCLMQQMINSRSHLEDMIVMALQHYGSSLDKSTVIERITEVAWM